MGFVISICKLMNTTLELIISLLLLPFIVSFLPHILHSFRSLYIFLSRISFWTRWEDRFNSYSSFKWRQLINLKLKLIFPEKCTDWICKFYVSTTVIVQPVIFCIVEPCCLVNNMLPSHSVLKMEEACSSETSVSAIRMDSDTIQKTSLNM
jgi:hypothetical protein